MLRPHNLRCDFTGIRQSREKEGRTGSGDWPLQGLGESRTEEGEHEVASDVAEGEKLERIVSAVEGKSARMATMAAERGKHLLGEFGEHGGVVLPVDHEALTA